MNGKIKVVGILALAVIVIGITVVAALGTFFDEDNVGMEITSRTEYIGGDIGQVLTDVRFAISNMPAPATCWASALYPDKTALFTNEPMSGTVLGTYNYSFTVPNIEGVYEYQAICEVSPGRNVTRSKAFHVSSAFRLLTEDIRSQVSFLEMGVDEVQLNTNSRNGWKIESPFVTDISDLTCRIQPLDEEAVILFSDDFTRAVVENPPLEPWTADEFVNNPFVRPDPDSYISGGTLNQYMNKASTAGFTYVANDVNLSFIPTAFYGEMDVTSAWRGAFKTNEYWYFAFHFYNSSDDIIGRLYLLNRYSGFDVQFNNCDGNPTPEGDSCGLWPECPGLGSYDTNHTHCETQYKAQGDQSATTWDVNIKELMANETDFEWEDIDRVRFRVATQMRGDGILTTATDDVIIIAEPTGTEYIDNPNQNFGINWSASRDNAVLSWHDYRVMCAVSYEVDINNGTRIAEAIEQYVYVSNHNRIRAVHVK